MGASWDKVLKKPLRQTELKSYIFCPSTVEKHRWNCTKIQRVGAMQLLKIICQCNSYDNFKSWNKSRRAITTINMRLCSGSNKWNQPQSNESGGFEKSCTCFCVRKKQKSETNEENLHPLVSYNLFVERGLQRLASAILCRSSHLYKCDDLSLSGIEPVTYRTVGRPLYQCARQTNLKLIHWVTR